ncbi:MAG: hypothetical protein U9R60_12980, partial [Bacteroidota bacterium]|nr:hypothetical protein [Bacteroidota bacterium]
MDSGYDVLKKAEVAKKVTKTLKFHESTGTMAVVPSSECTESGFQFLIDGIGHATHLGAFKVQNTYCLDANFDLIYPIRGTLTAANGDHIFTKVIGTSIDEDLGLIFHYMILDGAGRFEGATGHIDMWGLIDYDNMTFDL